MAIFFTSDEHYGHRNIIKFCGRPFLDVDDMREQLIVRHNEVVGADDDVWHLGDMFWRTLSDADSIRIVNRLNGRHFYVLGNHEEVMGYEAVRSCFCAVAVRTQILPESGPRKGIVLDHYAGRVWLNSDKGAWQLYGHTHAVLPEIDPLLSLDVGVDANDYYPISLAQVSERMAAKVARIQRGLGITKHQ